MVLKNSGNKGGISDSESEETIDEVLNGVLIGVVCSVVVGTLASDCTAGCVYILIDVFGKWQACSKALANAWMLLKRCAGSFCKAVNITCSTSAGRFGTRAFNNGGGVAVCCVMSSTVVPPKGR